MSAYGVTMPQYGLGIDTQSVMEPLYTKLILMKPYGHIMVCLHIIFEKKRIHGQFFVYSVFMMEPLGLLVSKN